MRRMRAVFFGLLSLAASCGFCVLVSGCSDESKTDGTQVKINEKEQKVVQDGMREFMANKKQATPPKK